MRNFDELDAADKKDKKFLDFIHNVRNMAQFFRATWIDPQTLVTRGYSFHNTKLQLQRSISDYYFLSARQLLGRRPSPFALPAEPIHQAPNYVAAQEVQASALGLLTSAMNHPDLSTGLFIASSDPHFWQEAIECRQVSSFILTYESPDPRAPERRDTRSAGQSDRYRVFMQLRA